MPENESSDALGHPQTATSQNTETNSLTTGAMREDMLKQAVSFLKSPSVQSADRGKKVAFLEKKGLNQQEIDEAFKRSEQQAMQNQQSPSPTGFPPPVPARPSVQVLYSPPPPPPAPVPASRILALAVFSGIASVTAIASLVGIIKHYLSKSHNSIADYRCQRHSQYGSLLERLKPSLADVTPSQTLVEDHCKLAERLDRVVEQAKERVDSRDPQSQLKDSLFEFRKLVTSQYYAYPSYGAAYGYLNHATKDDEAVQKFKEEIRGLKGMLLSRRNFPQASTDRTPVSISPSYMNHPRRRRSNHTETQ